MPSRLVAGLRRRRKRRVRERADEDDDELLRRLRFRAEDRRTALRAEGEVVFLPILLVGDTAVLGVPAFGSHLLSAVSRLEAERAPCPTLTREAMTDRDGHRLAVCLEAKLPTVASGVARGHGTGSYGSGRA
jgi:hypothetical protein